MRIAPMIPGYRIIECIGEGGMSTVWKAWDLGVGRYVAIKVLRRELAGETEEVRQFRSEERLMEEIRHPGIVEGYSFDIACGNWYVVMEYVDGYSFANLLRRKGRVGEDDCLAICESVAAALDYVWEEHGVVHCDIKPENIMINSDGIVKLTDLGISSRFDLGDGDSDVIREAGDHIVGTPAYISPEQVYGDVVIDCRADIYSLGATLYHLATGRVLFPGLDTEEILRRHCGVTSQAPDPRTIRPELSFGFCQLLESMLVKDREWRTDSWQSVAAACREISAGNIFELRRTPGVSSVALNT